MNWSTRKDLFAPFLAGGVLIGLAGWLVLLSDPAPRIGDGAEYFLMTMAWGEKGQPYGDPDVDRIYDQYQQQKDSSFISAAELNAPMASLKVNGQQDFPHFWFYSLLATPFYLFLNFFGGDIGYGFTLLNLCLFGILLFIAGKELGAQGIFLAAVLVLASPLLWFLDKAHTEVFTIVGASIGVIYLFREKPSLAFLAFGIVSTQNPPFMLLGILALVVSWFRDPNRLRVNRWALVVGMLVMSLHPLYYQVRHGAMTPQLITGAASSSYKGLCKLTCFVIDPDVGLLANWPWIFVPLFSVLAVAIWQKQKIQWPIVAFCLLSVVVLGWAQSKTTNFNHGGTFKVSRYALWYIPLLFPLLVKFSNNYPRVPSWQRGAVLVFLVVAVVANAAQFHPGKPESFLHQSNLAEKVYDHFPTLYDPVPEIFIERCERAELPTEAWAIANRSGTKIIVHQKRFIEQRKRLKNAQPLDPVSGWGATIDPSALVGFITQNIEVSPNKTWFYVNNAPIQKVLSGKRQPSPVGEARRLRQSGRSAVFSR